ncbi:MAG: polyhydroxybutyrate depolymerase [Acidobacteriota bacterium]|nr:polyhydroxybutyrate depolymerase [Acidobacteriota bacterium]
MILKMRALLTLAISLFFCATVVAQRGASVTSAGAPLLVAPHTQVAGDSEQTINVGGMQRSYILHIPPGYDGSTPVPLVFVLHGMGGKAKGMEQLTGMSAKADAEKFIVVYPQAVGNPTVWNTGFSSLSNNGADDVAFIRALANKLEHDLKIDTKRIYCCGFSSGAIMTYLLGAEMSHRFAAIGVAAGFVGVKQPDGSIKEDPNPAVPVSVIAFHGKKDQTIYYNGGGALVDCLSVADSIAFWVKADGCATPGQAVPTQDANLSIEDYNQCTNSREVILYTFANGTHEWPKLQNNDHFSATDAIWKFFAQHPKP